MDFEPFYSVILFFWAVCLVFFYREYRHLKLSNNIQDKNYLIAILVVLGLGVLVRTIWPSYPLGIFSDESIGGYDIWCIANYGVDSHLYSYPVYFKSWGSGQSALYAYFTLPLVKIFGLSLPVFRLPMMLMSCISLLTFYHALRKANISAKLLFLIILIFVISPWHWMMSRWALDCNLCPSLLLIAVSLAILICYEVSSKKRFGYAILSSMFIALSAYAYGISWFMLPLFCILITGYLVKTKKMTILQVILCGGLMLFILIPLICFAFVMFFDIEEFTLGFISIPELGSSRADATTLIKSTEPLATFLSFIKRATILIIAGDDKLRWNSFIYWGQFYNILGLPFIFYTLYDYVKQKKLNNIDWIFILWFISVIPMLFLIEPNTNHWNLVWFPLLYFLARGIYLLISKYKRYQKAVYTLLFILAISFGIHYFLFYSKSGFAKENVSGFVKGLEEVIHFADNLDIDHINNVDIPAFSMVLFYAPINPYEYAKIKKNNWSKDYGKNYFKTPFDLKPSPRTA